MSIPGGRASKRLCVAGALLLFLLPLIPLTPAQSVSDPWWGPTDRAQPTAGFSIRVPVTVENKFDYVLRDAYVAAQIDFGKLLVEAGWTNETRGATVGPRGFTLDVNSIRVVPYNRGFVSGPIGGSTAEAIPHVFYPSLFDAPRHRAFDAARNPAGTILFQLDQDLAPQAKRDYYVYAKPLEFGASAPPVFDPLVKGSLDAYLWGTTGTVTYGWQPHQPGQGHRVSITNLASGINKVTVSTYDVGSFSPMTSTQRQPNPLTLEPGGSREISIPANRAYKIESEKPVRVIASGQQSQANSGEEANGFVPGLSGSFADDQFVFELPSFAGGRTSLNVGIIKASPGTVTVSNDRGDQRTLTNANPTNVIPVGDKLRLTGTGKFLVSFNPSGEQQDSNPTKFPRVQVPSLQGSVSGLEFWSFIMNENGYINVCPEADASIRILRGNLQLVPDGALPDVAPYAAKEKTFCDEIEVPRIASKREYYEFISVPGADGSPRVPFRLHVGAGERFTQEEENLTRPFIGPWGGLAGIDYDVWGPAGMFGHYNDTSITIFEERQRVDGTTYEVNRTTSLRRDQFALVELVAHPERTGRYHIVASKPISVTSLAPAVYETLDEGSSTGEMVEKTIPYVRHIPGRPVMPNVTVGAVEFRGPLVDLRSPARPGSLQDFLTTGPGSPVSYRLDVVNLGRWVGAEDLTDTFTISCVAPEGWRVDGCEKEVTLGSRSSERLNIVVTPSVDDVNLSKSIVVEARSKAGGTPAQFKLNVHVEVRYGVGMWFDVEDGRKTIDPPIGLDPAGEHEYTIVLKNTGSTTDTFDLTVEDAREGWSQELLLDGEPISVVRLDGGQSVLLDFRVKAPDAETAPQNIVSIVAQSRSNALAADVVNTATRIRPKVDLELTLDPQTHLAAPNETVTFNISTRNKGNDVFTIYLEQDSILPKGWVAQMPLSEITLSPNDSTILQLRVTPPVGARAGDLASVKIAAEVDTGGAGGRVPGDEISAIVVVRRVYDIVVPPIADAEALPGTTLRFVLPVSNQGNGQVALELLPGAVEAMLVEANGDTRLVDDWKVTMDVETVTLDLNESADLPLVVEVPPGTPPGLYNISFTSRLSREALQNLTLPVGVRALSRVEFVGLEALSLTPGREITIPYTARNTGNVEASFALSASAPTGWEARVSPDRARLAPGESVGATLVLNASRDANDGDYVLRLEAQAADAAATPTDVRIAVARPQLYLADVSATGALRAGELVLVTANVGNRGGLEASNVSVALLVDGRVVDRVLLARVPVGSTSVATMSWVATQRGGDVSVVLDPDEEISLVSREDTQADVQFGSRLDLPAPGVLALLAVLGALALTAGTRRMREGDQKGPMGRARPHGERPTEREQE